MQTFTTNFLVRKFSVKEVSADYLANRPKICGNCPFDEDFLTRKLGKKNCILRCDSTNLFLTNVLIADEYSGPFQTSERKLFLQKSSTTTSC